jgi:very-short-patch-repair endonuclease
MRRSGGIVDARVLVAFTSRRKVRTALKDEVIVRDARGKYALPGADDARRAAARLSGVVTGKSAAAVHGWPMKTPPELPTVTVPHNRKVARERREGIDLKWRDIPREQERHGVLLPGPTVIDCARRLPFDEALSIADSALRAGDVTRSELLRLAGAVATTGRERALRVAREASAEAANPFESVLRAIALDVPGLDLRPQVPIAEGSWRVRPDLVDVGRRLVVEADSFEFHAKRAELKRDCERYNALVLRGWRVVRFAWEHVMFEPSYVQDCLARLTESPPPAGPLGRAALARSHRKAA